MNWLKPYTEGTFLIFAGNVIEGFQPLDFFHFYPMWQDLWIKEIVKMIDVLDLENKSYQEVKHLLPPPSNLRAIFQKIVPCYKAWQEKDPIACKKVLDVFGRFLFESCPEDPFAINMNPFYRPEEVLSIVNTMPWKDGSPVIGKKVGQFITAAGSFVHGLYNDLVTDLGWDAYGPYTVTHEGQEYNLLVRHFPNMQPGDLWPEKYLGSAKDIKVYCLYQGVEWRIACVGCHTIALSGKPVEGLKKYAIEVDGKFVDDSTFENLIKEFAEKGEAIYREIRAMDMEQIKEKVAYQECYQLKPLFDAAGMDWRPTEAMLARFRGKPLLTGVLPHGVCVSTVDEYRELFNIRYFEEEVLGQKVK